MVSACSFCQERKPAQQAEPLRQTPLPGHPWEIIGADMCEHKGENYLVLIDYYSRYIELLHMDGRDTTSHAVIMKMKCMFAR